MKNPKDLNILIGCEESQIVCIAFRERGFNAFSCDLQECSGGHPEWHIKDDVLNHLNDGWDCIIAHPECRYLCFSGERWITEIPGRSELRKEAFEFFMKLYNAPIKFKVLENSHSVFLEREFRKPDQYLHPYHFGDPYKKLTCLWLNGLPPLIPTNIVFQRESKCHKESPGKDRSKIRAKTYSGFAFTMAQQWGDYLLK